MRIMGIDFGSKKVGVALTDPGGKMAFPHSVLPNNGKLFDAIIKIIEDQSVKEVVIGHSLNRDGTPNDIHAGAESLMLDLTLAAGIPIHLEPEQYSTQAALRIQGKHDKIDASAAALILESYLMKRN